MIVQKIIIQIDKAGIKKIISKNHALIECIEFFPISMN